MSANSQESFPIFSVVATSGRRQLCRRLLQSLEQCLKPSQYRGVVLVENGPRSGIAEDLSSFALDIQYFIEPEANKSKALNRALQELPDGALIYFHDDDVTLDPKALVSLEEAARHTSSCFFGGPVTVEYEVPPPPWLIERLPFSAKGFFQEQFAHHPFFLGANWAVFAADLRQVRDFEVAFGPGRWQPIGEETRIQQRLKEQGFRPHFLEMCEARHFVPADRCSSKWLLRRKFREGIGEGLSTVEPHRRLRNAISTSARAVFALVCGQTNGRKTQSEERFLNLERIWFWSGVGLGLLRSLPRRCLGS